MKEEYQKLDSLLSDGKYIRDWLEDREHLLLETLRMTWDTESRVTNLSACGREIEQIVKVIKELKDQRGSQYFY